MVVRENGRGVEVVRFAGELDIATIEELGEALSAAVDSGAPVVVDLSECTFIDSMGISVILRAARTQANGSSGSFALAGVRDQVDRVLKLTGVETELTVYDDATEAVAALGPRGA